MERIWAPWRLEYVQKAADDPSCVFCLKELGHEDRLRHVLHRGEHCFVVMNRFPYSNGHLMVAPYRHVAQPGALNSDEALELHRLTVLCIDALHEAFAPQGFNVGLNLGKTAGAGIADHLHQHIVPRWEGDTNFMTVFAEVRVIPQHLDNTYLQLLQIFTGLTDN